MPTSKSKAIKGLSIANIVLAAIAIVVWIIFTFTLGLSTTIVSDPSVSGELSEYLSYELSNTSSSYAYDFENMSGDDVLGLTALVLGLGIAFSIWAIICSVICLVAGIIGLRGASRPEKLGSVFGWSIAAAIFSFLGGSFGMISMALFIIAAVFAHLDRKASAQPYGQMPPYGGTGQQGYGYGQPYDGAQPPYMQGQSYAAPQQPYTQVPAPQQPYQQPYQQFGAEAQQPYAGAPMQQTATAQTQADPAQQPQAYPYQQPIQVQPQADPYQRPMQAQQPIAAQPAATDQAAVQPQVDSAQPLSEPASTEYPAAVEQPGAVAAEQSAGATPAEAATEEGRAKEQ